MTRRIKLVVAYDGTDFCGWAANTGHRTVQGTLTEAVRRISGEDCEITGASRTDSGAHAEGQVCHFDVVAPVPTDRWADALNRVLPDDLVVKRAADVGSGFHSRFCASYRHYRYRFLVGEDDPFRGRFTFKSRYRLDVSAMQNAGARLVGTHDFRSFSENLDPSVENTVRTLIDVRVSSVRDEVRFDVKGTAFVRGMMRRMAGGLFEVGRGHRDAASIEELLAEPRSGRDGPVVLPACGLTLMRIVYGRHPRDVRPVREQREED